MITRVRVLACQRTLVRAGGAAPDSYRWEVLGV